MQSFKLNFIHSYCHSFCHLTHFQYFFLILSYSLSFLYYKSITQSIKFSCFITFFLFLTCLFAYGLQTAVNFVIFYSLFPILMVSQGISNAIYCDSFYYCDSYQCDSISFAVSQTEGLIGSI